MAQRILWIHARRMGPGRSIDDGCGTGRSDGTRPGLSGSLEVGCCKARVDRLDLGTAYRTQTIADGF